MLEDRYIPVSTREAAHSVKQWVCTSVCLSVCLVCPTATLKNYKKALEINGGTRQLFQSSFSQASFSSIQGAKNIKDAIVRAKLASERPKTVRKGVKNCGNVLAFSFMQEGKIIEGHNYKDNKFKWTIGRL